MKCLKCGKEITTHRCNCGFDCFAENFLAVSPPESYFKNFREGKLYQNKRISMSNGSIYNGELLDGIPNGTGACTFSSGDAYDGSFVDGMRSGRGVYKFANGTIYDGEFKEDKFCGKGIITYSSGDAYDGSFVDGMRSGRGVYKFASGTIYDGEFKEGKFHGKGMITYPNGTVVKGEWDKNKLIKEFPSSVTSATASQADPEKENIPHYIRRMRDIVQTNAEDIRADKNTAFISSRAQALAPKKMSGAMFNYLEPMIEEEYEIRVGRMLEKHVTQPELAEFDTITDPSKAAVWLTQHVPNYYALVAECGKEIKAELEKYWLYYSMESNLSFLLPVEDVFDVTGRGTIVVGRVAVGNISVGDPVVIILNDGSKLPSAVTSIEMFRKIQSHAQVGANVGIGLKGVSKSTVLYAQAIVNAGAEPQHTSFTARIHLHSKEKGGSGKPIFNHYYPHYDFSTSSSRGMTTFKNNSLEMLTPGQNTEVEVVLDKPCVIYSGMHFGIHEGGKNYVAKGEIIAIND